MLLSPLCLLRLSLVSPGNFTDLGCRLRLLRKHLRNSGNPRSRESKRLCSDYYDQDGETRSESSTGGGGGSSAAPRQRNTTSIKAAAAIGIQPVTVPISFRRREESQMNRGERQLAPEIGCEYSSPITLSKLHGRCKKSEVEELMYPRYRF
ncbi:hypothetical protein DY000_02013142 [Brassica cretica]|uniref:DUF4005 domain-containing protein n=1 Tax=Brassica cretica TaxID=69181 RepID=A0ABQ7D2K6_BRACR|nr:hypothetical protein DY000_02013142 [Brassica cretica]